MSEPIRVVVADDSAFIRGLIVSYLQSTGGFEIVGTLPEAYAHPSLGFVDAFVMYKTIK